MMDLANGSCVLDYIARLLQKLLLCTGNPGKVSELKDLLDQGIQLLALGQVGLPMDLPETGATLEENALQKARYAFERTGLPCLADDTGLEVDRLNGAPGVHSARYAGAAKDALANMQKLLDELGEEGDRSARFRTVLAYIDHRGDRLFEGIVRGSITHRPRGTGGFGYDAVFQPDGSALTFAQMSSMEKNALSHRGKAMEGFLNFIASNRRTQSGE